MSVNIKKTYGINLDEEQAEQLMTPMELNAGRVLGTSLSPVFKSLRQALGERAAPTPDSRFGYPTFRWWGSHAKLSVAEGQVSWSP